MKTTLENSKSVIEIDSDYPLNGTNMDSVIRLSIISKTPDKNGHTHGHCMDFLKEDFTQFLAMVNAHKSCLVFPENITKPDAK